MPCVKSPPRTWRRKGNALLRIASDPACSDGPFDKPKFNWINCVRGGRRYSLQAQGDFCGTALHHLRIGRTQEPQIADQQGPDGLGVPNEDIVERQPQAIGLALLVEDVNHQHPWLAPGGRKAVAALRRLPTAGRTPRPHASTIEADADPLAGQRALGGPGQTRPPLKCRTPNTGPG